MPTTSDFSAVTVTTSKPEYATGDTITVSVAGSATLTQTGPVRIEMTVTTATGAKGNLDTSVEVSRTFREGAKILAITDDEGRTYTVAADGKSATAVA